MTLQLANLVIFFLVVYSSYGKELKECGVSQSAVVRVPLVVLRSNTNQAESQFLFVYTLKFLLYVLVCMPVRQYIYVLPKLPNVQYV